MTEAFERLAAMAKKNLGHPSALKVISVARYLDHAGWWNGAVRDATSGVDLSFRERKGQEKETIIDCVLQLSGFEWNRIKEHVDGIFICELDTLRVFHEL